MAIYTQKEYDNKSTKSPEVSPEEPSSGETLPPEVLPERVIAPKKRVFEFWLLHPEIPKFGDPPTFEDNLNLEGKVFFRKCIRGIVKSSEKPLVDFLRKKDWEVIHKEEI